MGLKSPILFTLYLAKALEEKPSLSKPNLQDHTYAKLDADAAEDDLPVHLKEHAYCKRTADPYFCIRALRGTPKPRISPTRPGPDRTETGSGSVSEHIFRSGPVRGSYGRVG